MWRDEGLRMCSDQWEEWRNLRSRCSEQTVELDAGCGLGLLYFRTLTRAGIHIRLRSRFRRDENPFIPS